MTQSHETPPASSITVEGRDYRYLALTDLVTATQL